VSFFSLSCLAPALMRVAALESAARHHERPAA
jgi:hypothetical protein